MTTTYIITTVTFEKLKQKAKKLKKEKNIPHHEALDIVANDYGKVPAEIREKDQVTQSIFLWKHIADAHNVTRLAEDAINRSAHKFSPVLSNHITAKIHGTLYT